MSPLHFVIMLIVAIIILTVLTLKFKMHPVMVLFLTATFCGLASGKTLVDTFAAITKYFGSTLGSIGVMIIFGAVIASGINDTGAATSMVNFFIKKFKGKCLELAPALTGFIMSIPVFGDIAIILNQPSLEKFESKVKPGGVLIYDGYGIINPPTRKDIHVYRINAMDAANEMNNAKAFNMIVLGGLLKIKPMVTLDSVLRGLKKTLPERHHHLIPMNEEAIKKGMELIQEMK